MTSTRPIVEYRDISPGRDYSQFVGEQSAGPAAGHTFTSIVSERDPAQSESLESAGWIIAGLGIFIFCAVLVGQRLVKK